MYDLGYRGGARLVEADVAGVMDHRQIDQLDGPDALVLLGEDRSASYIQGSPSTPPRLGGRFDP